MLSLAECLDLCFMNQKSVIRTSEVHVSVLSLVEFSHRAIKGWNDLLVEIPITEVVHTYTHLITW